MAQGAAQPLLQPIDSLDGALQLPLKSPDVKSEIVNAFWNTGTVAADISSGRFDAYFDYYIKQCELATAGAGIYIEARSHNDIIEIINEITGGKSRDDLYKLQEAKLARPNGPSPTTPVEKERVQAAIDLAASLLVMMEIGGERKHGARLAWRAFDWQTGTLKSQVDQHFKNQQTVSTESVRLQRIFNAKNLTDIAGMEIDWTGNLADHLRLIDGDKKIAIFHHATFLKQQQKSPNSIYDKDLIDETVKTMALLFPQGDDAVKKWYLKLKPPEVKLDPTVLQCGHLIIKERRIDNFNFWRERLIILKQLFDDAEPGNIPQWWRDRRKKVQWYTFWVAILVLILTVFFGLVQSIEGGIQVYKAYHPSRSV